MTLKLNYLHSMHKDILIVDDNASVRQSLRHLLDDEPDWRVCGEAVNGRDAVEKVERLHPDLVLLDFSMPVMNGIEAGSMLKHMRPALPVLLLTAFKDKFLEKQAIDVGISGVVSKQEDIDTLLRSVRDLLNGSSPSGLPLHNN
jgi:DNA-binding NarL/FixJ family response regulator